MSDPDKWGIDLTPDEADTFMAAICEARRGPDLPDPLVALRAEVEAMRDEMHVLAMKADDVHRIETASVGVHAYTTVLDLIDKHIRSAAMDELVQQTQEMGGYDQRP